MGFLAHGIAQSVDSKKATQREEMETLGYESIGQQETKILNVSNRQHKMKFIHLIKTLFLNMPFLNTYLCIIA